MGTDNVHNQAEDRDKDSKRPPRHSQGEIRNSILGSKDDAPATDTATAFQSDQQYPATGTDPILRSYEEQKDRQKKSSRIAVLEQAISHCHLLSPNNTRRPRAGQFILACGKAYNG